MDEATSEELKGPRSSREIGASGRETGAICRAQHGSQTEDTEQEECLQTSQPRKLHLLEASAQKLTTHTPGQTCVRDKISVSPGSPEDQQCQQRPRPLHLSTWPTSVASSRADSPGLAGWSPGLLPASKTLLLHAFASHLLLPVLAHPGLTPPSGAQASPVHQGHPEPPPLQLSCPPPRERGQEGKRPFHTRSVS